MKWRILPAPCWDEESVFECQKVEGSENQIPSDRFFSLVIGESYVVWFIFVTCVSCKTLPKSIF